METGRRVERSFCWLQEEFLDIKYTYESSNSKRLRFVDFSMKLPD